MNHIVFYSSGVASWLSAMRVSKKYGQENLYLLFADTGIEDEDNYRFLHESSKVVGGKLVILKTGKTPWDIFHESKWLSNRQGKTGCSYQLKVLPCEQWIKSCSQFTPENTILYFGINFEEIHRIDSIRKNWSPFSVETPLCWDFDPWADRQMMMTELAKYGLKRPRLYDMGFAHANCGGFCVKAGLGHYRNLLKQIPERYKHHEEEEERWRHAMNRYDVAILTRQKDGVTKSITLKKWRESIESEPQQLELFEALGGCNCFVED